MKVPIKNIPTYDAVEKTWSKTSFDDQSEFADFLTSIYKDCGEYDFDETTTGWNALGIRYTQLGSYTDLPKGSQGRKKFWDDEKLKCRLGVIWKNGDKTWYLTRDYYFFLNFCPITNKEKGFAETFVSIRDTQYHLALYEKLAEVSHLHSCILKRRQMAYSFHHAAKMINAIWFEKKVVCKMFASDDDFITGENGTWKFIESYSNFLNKNTDWKRAFTGGAQSWIQKEKVKVNGEWQDKGLESTLIALTLKKDPKKGVGGPLYYGWYEEGGIAPTADVTLGYLNPALESGGGLVGSFIFGGSVGDLTECKPLEKFMKDPELYRFLKVKNKWYDEVDGEGYSGLFIPAQYGMPNCVDKYGNSDVSKALAYLNKAENEGFAKGEFGKMADEKPWKELPPEEYRLLKSQNPKFMSEAFAYRKESIYPTELIKKQQDRIKLDTRISANIRNIAFYEKDDGSVKWKFEEYIKPITEYPYRGQDKRGCVQMVEDRVIENPDKFVYFAGVDPVATDKSTTSDSLFAIYIVKGIIEKKKRNENGIIEVSYDGMKPVCWYVGRYDDMKEHHLIAEYMIRYYNAHTLVENNVSAFIDYMKQRNLRQYLVTKNELRWAADLGINNSSSREYGVYMSMNGAESRLRTELINHSKNYLSEELDRIFNNDEESPELIRVVRGVERIQDVGLLEEFKQYRDGGNYDRWFAFNYALKMASFYFSEGVYTKASVIENDELEVPKPQMFKQPRGFFRTHDPTPLRLGEDKVLVPKKGFFKTR
jgi:hypothetical protein